MARMPNLISARLATRAQVRQVEASLRADSAANAVDREVGSVWAQVLRLLRSRPSPLNAQHHAKPIFRQLLPAASASIDKSLRRVASWGHVSTVRALTDTLSTHYLRAAASQRLFESRANLLEDRDRRRGKLTSSRPGVIQIALKAAGFRSIDLGALLREPVSDQLGEGTQKDIFASLLFPPPDEQTLADILYATVAGVTWFDRLAGATRTSAQPEDLAELVGGGFARGATPQQIARDLLPAVDRVRSTARRIARTESMRIAHSVQHLAWQGMGDLVIGYQIHATLDQNTRPAHAARNGTIYYADPKPGQLGYDKMPHPPLEADGSIAWNCRCHTSPVLAADPAIADNPELLATFANASDQLIPDPVAYGDWFAQADERRRKTAVGSRRYSLVRGTLGQDPDWAHFLDPESGELLPLATLKNEGHSDRAERVNRVRTLMAHRRELIKQVQTYGFLAS